MMERNQMDQNIPWMVLKMWYWFTRRDLSECGRNGVPSDLADGRGLGIASRVVFENREGTEERALVVDTDLRGDR